MNSKKYLSTVFFSTAHGAKKLWVMVFFAALIGCGGGGSSSPSSENELPSPVAGGIDDDDELIPDEPGQPPVTPVQEALLPTINVGGSQYADPNVLVTLNATVEAAAGAQIVRTLWTQVSGPSVRIPNPSALNNLILMPDVAVATPVEFRFTAVDDQGRINSTTLLVLVKPVPTFVRVIGGVFNESEQQATLIIRLNAASETPVTVVYFTREGTAISGSDFIPTSGEIIFEPGVVEQTVTVDLIDDEITELDEIFNLYVTTTMGTETFANSGVVIIRNGIEPTEDQQIQFTNAGPVTIYDDEQYTNPLNPDVVPAGTGDVIYSSSNSSVASINSSGVITAVSAGTAQITVMKMADEVYRAAEDTFELQVLSRGTPASVSILYSNSDGGLVTATTDTVLSIQVDDTLDLTCDVQDLEDGQIPDPDTGEPANAVAWRSNIDGTLAVGPVLDISTLSQGRHMIICTAVDSDENSSGTAITVLVGNIAPIAVSNATSSFCPNETLDPENCYSPERINDSDLSTTRSGFTSWNPVPSTEQSVSLVWPGIATITQIDLYTTTGFPIRDYDIEYFDGELWIPIASIDGNTDVIRTHTFATVNASQIRLVVRSGPDNDPTSGRVNELVVWGDIDPSF